jgi:hypothetical protein
LSGTEDNLLKSKDKVENFILNGGDSVNLDALEQLVG